MRFLSAGNSAGPWPKPSRSSQYHLLTDGTHLYTQSSAREIVDILKNSNQPILGICLTDVSRQVRGRDCLRKILR
jgi:hypothetical protein